MKKVKLNTTKKLPIKDIIMLLLIVIMALALGVTSFLYLKEKDKVNNPEKITEEEAKKIKEDVSKLILLPDDEPTIATIFDVEEAKNTNQEFYKNAQNGDVLLVFSETAMLYRPKDDKLIKVSPVVEENATQDTQESQ